MEQKKIENFGQKFEVLLIIKCLYAQLLWQEVLVFFSHTCIVF